MDPIIRYLRQFYHCNSQDIKDGTKFLMDTYKIIIKREELKTWRFRQGRKKANDFHPMYCAFVATPHSLDDWFVLRLVDTKSANGKNQVAIGFCLDYGIERGYNAWRHPVIERRIEISKKLKELTMHHPNILNDTPLPTFHDVPYPYKGFDLEFERPDSPQELADLFIQTVLQWEKLLNLL